MEELEEKAVSVRQIQPNPPAYSLRYTQDQLGEKRETLDKQASIVSQPKLYNRITTVEFKRTGQDAKTYLEF